MRARQVWSARCFGDSDGRGAVKSPTFTLLETYEAGGLKVNHFDFTALKHPKNSKMRGLPTFMQREPSAPPNGAAKPLRLYLRPT